jgi:hypothetical protein
VRFAPRSCAAHPEAAVDTAGAVFAESHLFCQVSSSNSSSLGEKHGTCTHAWVQLKAANRELRPFFHIEVIQHEPGTIPSLQKPAGELGGWKLRIGKACERTISQGRRQDSAMRFFYLLFLLVFLAAVGGFAYYNQQEITLQFWNWSIRGTIAAVLGAAYLLGMLSGWTVVGLLRRSLKKVTERPISSESSTHK